MDTHTHTDTNQRDRKRGDFGQVKRGVLKAEGERKKKGKIFGGPLLKNM